MAHVVMPLKVLYFGTPVVIVSSRNPDGSTNLAPMSSAWWLGQAAMIGMSAASQTAANLGRDAECVLNLAPASLVDAVDRLALSTGRRDVPAPKAAMGYEYEPDKFGRAGLTPQPGQVVGVSRVAECPIQLECRVTANHPFDGPDIRARAFQVEVLRAHVEESVLVPGTSYVDPIAWDPLIMKFCDFFGGSVPVSASRLADAWGMPSRVAG